MGTVTKQAFWFRWSNTLSLLVAFALFVLASCDEFEDVDEAPASTLVVVPSPSSSPKPSEPSGLAAPAVRTVRREVQVDEPVKPPRMYVDEYVDTPKRGDDTLPSVDDEAPGAENPERPPGARVYPQNVSDKPIPRVESQPWIVSEKWMRHHERLLSAPNRSEAQVVFIGDSIVEGWRMAPAYREHFGKYSPLNLGIAGDHTQHVLYRIEQGELRDLHPKAVVVLVGVNNLAGGFTPAETVSGVRAVVGAIQRAVPSATVLLLAVLPARESPEDPLRDKIADANRQLRGLAGGSVVFHDAGAGLVESDGTIQKTTLRDFIHPTAAGYELLSSSVAPALAEIVGS